MNLVGAPEKALEHFKIKSFIIQKKYISLNLV